MYILKEEEVWLYQLQNGYITLYDFINLYYNK